jgi:hypothetical protein
MREVLQVLLIGATGVAAYAVVFNWTALVVNARNQKRRVPGRVSPIFLVPQIIAFITAMFRSAAGLRFPPPGCRFDSELDRCWSMDSTRHSCCQRVSRASSSAMSAPAAQYALQSKKETLPYRRWYDSILEPCCQCAHCPPTGAMRGGDQTKIELF